MTWSETTSADGKKIVTVKVDSVFFDGKTKVDVPTQGNVSNIHTSVDTSKVITVTGYKKNSKVAVPAQGNVNISQMSIDTSEVITVTGYKTKANVSAIVIKTNDDNIAEKSEKEPGTLTVTTTDKDGKKTITYVQKHEEKTSLPKDVLYIIDGKEMESGSMNDIDPTTIKSINVLKGENATKKYGEKAKSGVIEITTKKN